ncbi:MAG: TetR/AcrR family transcriptional regulator [Nocardioides sp.]
MSPDVHDTRAAMSAVALELFAERGYASTTVDDIVERVGVTQRTFFRHFGDKGEILFANDSGLLAVLLNAVDAAAPDARPLDVTRGALLALAEALSTEREALRRREAVIAGEPALRERQLLKLDRWAHAITERLVARGHPRHTAILATGLGSACWHAAWVPWTTDRRRASLERRLNDVFGELAVLIANDPRG